MKYIFDLDNSLYPDPKNKYARYEIAAAKAALNCGVPIQEEQARVLAAQSYQDHGSELTVFINDYGIDPALITEVYHEEAFKIFEEEIGTSDELRDAFNAIAPGDKVILTHSTTQWALPVIKRLGIDANIDPNNILALDDPRIQFKRKDADIEPFEVALQLLGARAEEVTMVDDVADNHIIPHQMGMHTLLIHWKDQDDANAPEHVQNQAHNPAQYIRRHLP